MSTHIERGHDYPSITQISVFLDNRVGRLLGLVQTLEFTDVCIVALSVMDSADCAIVRMVVDDVDTARNALLKGNYPFSEAELIAVELPPGKGGDQGGVHGPAQRRVEHSLCLSADGTTTWEDSAGAARR